MNLLFQSDFLKSLGWSLLDSLWQMGILWLVYQGIARTVKMTAARRYNLALLSLHGGTFIFFAGISYRLLAESAVILSVEKTATSGVQVPKNLIENFLPVLSATYIVIAAFLLVKLLIQVNQTRMLGRDGLSKVHPELRVFVQELSGRMGIKKKVEVWISSLIDAPMTIGYFKPVILLPFAALNGLNMEQTEAVLLHELEHIRRNDYLVNILVVVSESIFFFNPFAKSFIHIIRKERENSCDDTVLNFNYPGDSYATALLILEKNRNSFNSTVINAYGTHKYLLFNRVQRILTGKQPFKPDYLRTALGISVLTFISLFSLYQNDQANMALKNYAAKDARILWKENNLLNTGREPLVQTDLNIPALKFDEQFFRKAPSFDDQNESMNVAQMADNTVIQLHNAALMEKHAADMEENSAFMEKNIEMLTQFASANITREYSLSEPNTFPVKELAETNHPYIPSYSFEYTLVEDTLMPALKKTVTIHEIRAKAALDKAICELEAACKKNEGMEALMEIDLAQMKKELNKSMEEINWKEVEKQISFATEQSRTNEKLKGELQIFQKNRVLHQENLNRMKEKILLDRLNIQEQNKQNQRKTVVI